MKLFTVLSLFFILTLNNVFSQPFDMIPADDPILEDIRFLSLVTGTPFLSFTPPLAPGEIRFFLDSIDESALLHPAMEAYNRISQRLIHNARFSSNNGIFTSSLNINSTVEARARFNSDVAEYPLNPNISPFLSFPIKLFFADTLQLYIEPSVTKRPDKYILSDFDLNIPTGYFTYDESNPLKAYIAAGGEWWNFQMGRDRLYWGTGHTGSLTFSDNSQYFDFARISFFSPAFKYSFILNQFPITLTHDLFNLDEEDFDSWKENYSGLTRSMHRYFYLHRLDIKLFNRLSIGIMEGVMVGNSSIELKYLNPLVVFHSLFSWEDYDQWEPPYDDWEMGKTGKGDMTGSFFSLEINWNIINNFSVYGQFLINEYAEPGEVKRIENLPPNGLGYMAGLQFSHSLTNWASVYFLEFIYTDPYLNILSSPYASFIQQNRYKQYYYLGYPRDTLSITFGTRFFNNDNLSFSGVFSWIANGEHNKDGITWNWQAAKEAFNESTPSGVTENKYILSLGAGWKPLPWLVFKTGVTGIYIINNNHVPGKDSIGGQISFSAGLRF